MSVSEFKTLVLGAVDVRNVVAFHVGGRGQDLPAPYTDEDTVVTLRALADLMAGAGRDVEHGENELIANMFIEGEPDAVADEITIRQDVLDAMGSEVEDYFQKITQARVSGKCGRSYRCMLCPFRSFSRSSDLQSHVRDEHIRSCHFAPTSRKQLNIAQALFDDSQIRGGQRGNLVRQSAELMRECVIPAISGARGNIDRQVVLLLDDSGPRYINASSAIDMPVRRVGNTYLTREFADLVLQEALVHHGRIRTMVPALCRRLSDRGGWQLSLLPLNVVQWLGLVEDVLRSPTVQKLRRDLRAECLVHGEFEHISVDATLRIMRRIRE